MARSRNIKPSIMDNEELAELPPVTRLLFVYLWMLADREGRIEDRPKRIAAQALAYDRTADVEAMLCELKDGGFITRYVAAGKSVIQILSFTKHQSPHGTEKDSDLPDTNGYCTVHERGPSGCVTGKFSLVNVAPTLDNVNSPSSNALNHESGFLNPDTGTLKHESGTQIQKPFDPPPAEDGSASAVAVAKPVKVVKAKAPKDEAPTVGTWKAYSQAYGVRYSVDPVRNATVNGQLANLVSRLGADEAPAVAAFYVRSNNGRYVAAGHSVGMLVMDAEKLRTEWATGRQGTTTQAIQADKTATNLNAFAGLLAEAQAKDTYAKH